MEIFFPDQAKQSEMLRPWMEPAGSIRTRAVVNFHTFDYIVPNFFSGMSKEQMNGGWLI
jgi:hypothetical protein